MFPEDLKIYKYFDEEGKKITGYPNAGDTYCDYANLGPRRPRAACGHARRRDAGRSAGAPARPAGSPLFGHSPDFGYLYYGAVWYGDELWNGGRLKDYDGDGRVTPLEQLRYIDEELGGRYFTPWHKFNHPDARRGRDRRLQSQVLEPESAGRAPRGMDQEGGPVQPLPGQVPAPGQDRRRGAQAGQEGARTRSS